MPIACFGDVSGHLDPFVHGLARVGAVPGRPWPRDLAVVQVGDLVHKGPDSTAVVALVAELAELAGPGRFVQLAGNHEAVHLGGVAFACDPVSAATESTLRDWYTSGFLTAAVAIERPSGDVLVTHAGLTRSWWDRCGRPESAGAAAATLNALWRHDPVAFDAGYMLGGPPAPALASPLWAHPSAELWPEWFRAGDAPFSQVHGHASAFWWARNQWSQPRPDPVLEAACTVDRRTRRVSVKIGRHHIVGIDPGYGRYAARPLLPYVVHGTLRV